ncbi:hypothetical protein ACT8ZV_16320 [Nocardioides sp. MAHUQ-72]
MSAAIHQEQAARIVRAETRWLDQCAARLRQAGMERGPRRPQETKEVAR